MELILTRRSAAVAALVGVGSLVACRPAGEGEPSPVQTTRAHPTTGFADPATSIPAAEALASACERHGLPAPPAPEGGTGGWLTTETAGRGLRLEFRSKGSATILIEAYVTGSCAQPSDAGN